MKEADHKYKIQLCQEVLSVLDVVEPGLRLGRGNTIRYGEFLASMSSSCSFVTSSRPRCSSRSVW